MQINIDKDLNPAQAVAVREIHGPSLILAGAGAGKTRVLTYKIAYMLSNGIIPDNIIALTFTNKAAGEMKERVAHLLGAKHDVWLATFHSTGAKLLRRHIDVLGYDKNFVIFDEDDSNTLVKHILRDMNVDEKKLKYYTVKEWISKAKNKFIRSSEFKAPDMGPLSEKIGEAYRRYEAELKKNNAVDFDDLIIYMIDILKNKEILSFYQEKFKYILVDEYQDINHTQYKFLKLLASKYQNISVVGDEDQSIYGWRGAEIGNILNFSKEFDNVKTFKLEQNYRSTKNILSAANEMVRNNKARIGKTIWTENGAGELITFSSAETDHDEAKFVVEKISNYKKNENILLNNMAIFYRTNAQSRVFEDHLRKNNIPYKIYGGLKFYDRAEIKDVLAYMRVVYNPNDDISTRRILNLTEGIGKSTIDKLQAEASEKSIPIMELIKHGKIDSLSDSSLNKINKFFFRMMKLKKYSEDLPLSSFYEKLMNETSYVEVLQKQYSIEAESKLENLQEFEASLREFEELSPDPTLGTYLNEITLITSVDEKVKGGGDILTLMTLHMSKGLEYDAVFLVGLEEGLLPHSRAIMEQNDIEEERRLMYVGMTRARKYLTITNAKIRNIYGRTNFNLISRFVEEIPEKYLKDESPIKATSQFILNEKEKAYFKPTSETRVVYDDIKDQFKLGMKVRHKVYGLGSIIKIEGSGEKTMVTANFERVGSKKLLVKFASLEII